jgi:hypothetical protein
MKKAWAHAESLEDSGSRSAPCATGMPESCHGIPARCQLTRGATRWTVRTAGSQRTAHTRTWVFLDKKYPRIVDECAESMQATMPRSKVHRLLTPSNCYSVSAYSRSWPCLFPQHRPGVKHARPIFLSPWRQELAETWPDQLLKGLIQSDGCRFINTGRGGWRQPRYVFSNVSTDITSIFCSACDCLGLRWTAAFPKSETAAVAIYVSRKADVARLDEFVGPKR